MANRKKAAEVAEEVFGKVGAAVTENAEKAEKAVKKAVGARESVYVQYAGAEAEVSALAEAARADFKANVKRVRISDLRLYVKPEERAAYYVINDQYDGKVTY